MGVVFITWSNAVKNSGWPTITESTFFIPLFARDVFQSIVVEILLRSFIAIL